MADGNGSVLLAKMFEYGFRLMVVLLIPLLIWMVGTISSVDRRLVAVEASRFTAGDGNAMYRTILNELPPDWLLDKIEAIEVRLDRIEGHVP